jgi:hypothetical protein
MNVLPDKKEIVESQRGVRFNKGECRRVGFGASFSTGLREVNRTTVRRT